jgi:penicillin-binding protein 1C
MKRVVRWAALLLAAVVLAALGRPYDRKKLDPPPGVTLLDMDGLVLRRSGSQWTPLGRISPQLVDATLASEDKRFYDHHGVDIRGLVRAAALDVRGGRVAYGGSTITMQLVRLVDPAPRGVRRKLHQLVDAVRIERAFGKDEILEQYLNRAYYGNRAIGIEAAAQTYFGKPASMLSLGEATLLAALPRAPEAYDPYRHLDAALARRWHIISLMAAQGRISIDDGLRAGREPAALRKEPPPFAAPHFCDHVLAELGPDARGTYRTTLDGALQARLEREIAPHLAQLASQHVTNAGLIVIDNESGAVRALVGSADWRQDKVDIALVRRSPGSTLKPFLYALAIEQGDAPSTIAFDVHDDAFGRSHNADGKERGPVRYRDALGSSLNLAALDTVMHRVGVQPLVDRLAQGHVLPREAHAGPGIVLGGSNVRPLDLAAAFAVFSRGGEFRPWHDLEGRARPAQRLFSPQVAWIVSDMLADPAARRPTFGEELPLDLPFRVAAKTGTSAGFADNLTIATTREYTVLAWAGNFDGSPMHGVLAIRGAAPLVRATLLALRDRGPLTLPDRPDGVVTQAVCPLSGLLPGPHCPARKRDVFLTGTVPTHTCDWHRADGTIAYPPQLHDWAARHQPLATR